MIEYTYTKESITSGKQEVLTETEVSIFLATYYKFPLSALELLQLEGSLRVDLTDLKAEPVIEIATHTLTITFNVTGKVPVDTAHKVQIIWDIRNELLELLSTSKKLTFNNLTVIDHKQVKE